MSPVAYSGTFITSRSGAMVSNTRSHATESAGKGPTAGGAYGGNSGSGKKPFRHIDDIVSVTVDLDPHSTMRKVLETGDAHMRQAITFKDFGRPDLALQEYIKAFTVAVDKVPKHKDYPSLKSDRGDLGRLYHALNHKITSSGAVYDNIKEMIKEDNLKTGIQPVTSGIKNLQNRRLDLPSVPASAPLKKSTDNRDILKNGFANGHSTRPAPQSHDGSNLGRKVKPTVHPKPQALHGNSIKLGMDNASPDLVARFAKLRDHQDSATKSYTSSPPQTKPIGPRAMPSSQRLPLSVHSALPAMPKIPDAIYSPARGTVTSEAANLPSSTPRGMFSRTNSVVSVTGTPRTSVDSIYRTFSGEQFVTAHTYGESQASSTGGLQISEEELITVKELLRYMKGGSTSIKTLLIDVRDRQSFDEGHILSQNTICLDPTILSRQNISASDIADSMILAPEKERLALERRDEFDLIVFYDQDSKSIPQRATGKMEETAIFNLQQALVHYSFPKQLARAPKLLVGGLDAWIDTMGKQSLQTSETQSILSHATSTSASARKRLRNRTLKPEEIDTFEAMIGRDENGDFDYAKSQEDFMRRFPSIREPESMISREKHDFSAQSMGSGGEEFLKDMTPTPPVRPKPSVARTRYSGFESADDHAVPGALAMTAVNTETSSGMGNKPTGLYNPANWCYANSSIQALLSSRGFVDEFLSDQWPTKYRPDVSPLDPSYNQLMCRILGNLFQWLSQRSFEKMKAETLMHYLRTIHTGYKPREDSPHLLRFGDSNQHDSDEFITFIFGQLEAETRFKFTKNLLPQLDITRPVGFIANAWGNRPNNTIISRYWYLLEIHTLTCNKCKAQNFITGAEERYTFPIPNNDNGDVTQLLQDHYKDTQVGSECEKCGSRGKTLRKQLARLPPLLRVGLQRTNQTGSNKVLSKVRFPFQNFDLKRYAVDSASRTQIAQLLGGDAADGFDSGTVYTLYAVVSHLGNSLNSGHYISHVRADDGSWTQCNDTIIDPNMSSAAASTRLYTNGGGFTPVQLYYKREPKDMNSRLGNDAR
ncbi:hypothetical protein F5Y03DRAFT_344981 [Xylaria venustula]|nr:hypothetical protein F5Y03DRAFT_344981 [Xylaria venustula]